MDRCIAIMTDLTNSQRDSCIILQVFPESAYYYVACGEREKAMSILKQVADGNGKPMPKGRLKIDETSVSLKTNKGNLIIK